MLNEVAVTEKPDFYIDENEIVANREELISPSKKFKLVIRYYQTAKGCWNYSRGTVYRISDNKEICDIKRNYSTFHHAFIVKDNVEWLITGRNYTAQTVVNLETEKEYNSDVKAGGHGFCWSSYRLLEDGKTLLVHGCYWAGPYEYKLFDFSNPETGWPEIELEEESEYVKDFEDDGCFYSDSRGSKEPTFNNGNITFYQTRRIFKPLNKEDDELYEELKNISDDEYENPENWKITEEVKITAKIENNKIKIVDVWLSEDEKIRREKNKDYWKKYEEWKENFKKTDPLYLEYIKLIKNSKLNPDSWGESIGKTYKDWCPIQLFQKEERRWCRRIVKSHEDKTIQPYTIDLEWGVETGPIKLVIFKEGNHREDKFYPHSVEGMQEAFSYAINLCPGWLTKSFRFIRSFLLKT